jgi:RNA polymerase sigma-70 factor (ECF subfamily)
MIDWDGILRDEGPAIWRTLWRLLGNRVDVDECFQETFLTALQYSRGGGETIRHWSAFLQRVATTRAMDQLRKRYRLRRDQTVDEDDTADVHDAISARPGPVELAVASELSDQLRAALARLPEQQAETFALHALSGWSYDEIGRQLRMSSSNVGVTIHRARQRLRELLGDAAVSKAQINGGLS